MGSLSKNILWVIGGPESPVGTAATLTHVLPVRGMPGLDKGVTRQVDPAVVGNRIAIGKYAMQEDVNGALPLSPRACPSIGKVIKSAMGLESAPVQVAGCIRITYVGASASCKITAETSGDTLNSKVGDLGSETNDATFGTAGTIDLTNASFDTLSELVAAIDGYADYKCDLVFGAAGVSSAAVISAVVQAKNKSAYLWFTGVTGAYLRKFTLDLTDADMKAYTVQGEGYESTQNLFTGTVADVLALNGALGGFVEMDATLLGMDMDSSAAASGLSVADLEDRQPWIFQSGSTRIGGSLVQSISSLKFTVDNKSNKATFGQGGITRQYQQKGMVTIGVDGQVRLDSTSKAWRALKFSGSFLTIDAIYVGKTIASSMKEAAIIEVPYMAVDTFDYADRNGAIDAHVVGEGLGPAGGVIDVPMTISFVSQDSGTF